MVRPEGLGKGKERKGKERKKGRKVRKGKEMRGKRKGKEGREARTRDSKPLPPVLQHGFSTIYATACPWKITCTGD
jgi:hypothetical protein